MRPAPSDQSQPGVVIIGAGPAGLTAAWELIDRAGIRPIVLERSEAVGGLARTVRFKGNCLDLGGHRFFSKSERIMRWWLDVLPLQCTTERMLTLDYQRRTHAIGTNGAGPDPDAVDRVMLVRQRRSSIYYDGGFFEYPLRPGLAMCRQLGLLRCLRIAGSYGRAVVRPIREERNLEDFFINRFGRVLYRTFFKSYTEKVWGRPCDTISADWGRQRIRKLNVARSMLHALRRRTRRGDIAQERTDTSLIGRFLYPKFGPGQMWETVAERVEAGGGTIRLSHDVCALEHDQGRITAVRAVDRRTGSTCRVPAAVVISTMPVRHLVRSLEPSVAPELAQIAEGLQHRAFIVVGLLLRRLRLEDGARENWIYVHDPQVHVGRVQINNNWSPYCVADPDTKWISMEYFCAEGDALWSLDEMELIELALREGEAIGLLRRDDFIEGTVERAPHAYPSYSGMFDRFDALRDHLDAIENLYLIGRNGMHRYNNQDHSMLTAMAAIEAILAGSGDKSAIWAVNTEQEHIEERSRDEAGR